MHHALRAYFQDKLPLTEAQLVGLDNLLVPRHLKKHELLVRQGEQGRFGAFVVRGCLRGFVTDARQKEHILQFAPENWWISDQQSLIRQTPALFSIEAVEDSEVLLFGANFFHHFQGFGPEFQEFFHGLLQNSITAMQRRLIGVLSATAYLGITPESLSRIRGELARG
jgi:CRP-like cAMP-binding protein